MLEMNYLSLMPTKYDCCGKWVQSFSDRSGWFGKYLKPNEERICHNCIKGREGYAEEFQKRIGISIDVLNGSNT